jgi:hypothetical protein
MSIGLKNLLSKQNSAKIPAIILMQNANIKIQNDSSKCKKIQKVDSRNFSAFFEFYTVILHFDF